MLEIQVTISEKMEKESNANAKEHLKIRIPATIREANSYRVGEFIELRDKFGGLIPYIVDEAFAEDLAIQPNACFLTTKAFNRVFLADKQVGIQPIENLTLGCDPEAFLVDRNNNLMAAHRFFRKQGDVGNDGILLEFRPNYSVDENEVTFNISNLIKKARYILNRNPESESLRIMSASAAGKVTAGFHLHYGLPFKMLGFTPEVRSLARIMTMAFDYYIGIPSIVPEGERDCVRRTMPYIDYGKPGQFRLDNKTFEYRLPGGSNLRHPILTRGLLALGAIVVEDLASRVKEATEHFYKMNAISSEESLRNIYPHLPNMQELYSTICSLSIAPARQHLINTVIPDVRKMIGYKRRARSVEAYFKHLCENTEFSHDLEINWGGFNKDEELQGQMGVLQAAQ